MTLHVCIALTTYCCSTKEKKLHVLDFVATKFPRSSAQLIVDLRRISNMFGDMVLGGCLEASSLSFWFNV